MIISYDNLKDKLNLIRTNQIQEGSKVGVEDSDKYLRF